MERTRIQRLAPVALAAAAALIALSGVVLTLCSLWAAGAVFGLAVFGLCVTGCVIAFARSTRTRRR